jgi:anaerobic magnesium-protoporphyrin IX monomethyl ester cyclase
VKLALVWPPTCDPTIPSLALGALAAVLRPAGVEALLIDANLEAWEHMLQPTQLRAAGARVHERLRHLDRQPALRHVEQLEVATLAAALPAAARVAAAIDAALATMRDEAAFHDEERYQQAVLTIEAAQQVIAAAHAPTQVSFREYRTPFGLLNADEIRADAAPDRDPFHGYFVDVLAPRLRAANVQAVGLSVAFPGQLQPAFSCAFALRAALPGIPLLIGGPAAAQLFVRLEGGPLTRALGPFDLCCVAEGEGALLEVCARLGRRAPLAGVPGTVARDGAAVVRGPDAPPVDLATLPPPDFDGLPLGRYLSPHLVLPFDPTRGCYWGRCAFCHYGLCAAGTAPYRERPPAAAAAALGSLAARHGVRHFYLSQDAIRPATLAALGRELVAADLDLRFGTDLRPEPTLTPERCRELRRAGLLAAALGLESGDARVLALMDKGVTVDAAKGAARALAAAGVAVEAMVMTGFPSETLTERRATLRLLAGLAPSLSLFMVSEHGLCSGARVAREPARYGLREVFTVAGDELGTTLFCDPPPSPPDQRFERELDILARSFRLRPYPWAGALSTAHSLLRYDRHGADAFRGRPARPPALPEAPPGLRYDVAEVAATADEAEATIWEELLASRAVSRTAYETLAATVSAAVPRRARAPRARDARAPRARTPRARDARTPRVRAPRVRAPRARAPRASTTPVGPAAPAPAARRSPRSRRRPARPRRQ